MGKIYSRNIILDKDAGIGAWTGGELIYFIRTGMGKWSEADFRNTVRFGNVSGDQPSLRYPMIPYSNLSLAEVNAIYACLKTIPKIDHKVERKFAE